MIDFKKFSKAIKNRLSEDGKMHISKCESNFMWIETKDKLIGNLDCHYEIICKDQPKYGHYNNFVHIEVHFENDNTYQYFEPIKEIEGVNIIDGWDCIGIRMENKGHCIECVCMKNLVNDVIEDLYKTEEKLGDAIREIIKTNGIYNDNVL